MQNQAKLIEVANRYFETIQESEENKFLPSGTADYTKEIICSFTDFLAEQGSELRSLAELTNSELQKFYLSLREGKGSGVSVVFQLEIIVSFLIFAEKCGLFGECGVGVV